MADSDPSTKKQFKLDQDAGISKEMMTYLESLGMKRVGSNLLQLGRTFIFVHAGKPILLCPALKAGNYQQAIHLSFFQRQNLRTAGGEWTAKKVDVAYAVPDKGNDYFVYQEQVGKDNFIEIFLDRATK